MTESADDAMRERLTRLERIVRRWRRLGALVLAVIGLTLLIGAAVRTDPKTADDVLARHFILVGRTPSRAPHSPLARTAGPACSSSISKETFAWA